MSIITWTTNKKAIKKQRMNKMQKKQKKLKKSNRAIKLRNKMKE